MARALVSVIIPVYRTQEVLLRRCLESALGQSGVPVEVIAVEDASPDDCGRVLDEVASMDPRLRVVHRAENGRAGAARNDGLDLAQGDFVLFADADDCLEPDMCARLVSVAETENADIVACSWSEVGPDDQTLKTHVLRDRVYDLADGRNQAECFQSLNYALWNKLFRRATLAELRFESFPANIGEDTLFNVSALCRCRRMVTTPYLGYRYTLHESSATGRSTKGMEYLQALVMSGRGIEAAMKEGIWLENRTASRLTERMLLRRFATGCGWIAGNRDRALRADLWEYWRHYLRQQLYPSLRTTRVLGLWFRLASLASSPGVAYRLAWVAARLADRVDSRLACAMHGWRRKGVVS